MYQNYKLLFKGRYIVSFTVNLSFHFVHRGVGLLEKCLSCHKQNSKHCCLEHLKAKINLWFFLIADRSSKFVQLDGSCVDKRKYNAAILKIRYGCLEMSIINSKSFIKGYVCQKKISFLLLQIIYLKMQSLTLFIEMNTLLTSEF